MTNLISDAIEGFIILAILAGIYGFGSRILNEAGAAHIHGIMSYQSFTEELTSNPQK